MAKKKSAIDKLLSRYRTRRANLKRKYEALQSEYTNELTTIRTELEEIEQILSRLEQ